MTGVHKFDENGDVDKPLIKKIARLDPATGQVRYEIFREGDRWLQSREALALSE